MRPPIIESVFDGALVTIADIPEKLRLCKVVHGFVGVHVNLSQFVVFAHPTIESLSADIQGAAYFGNYASAFLASLAEFFEHELSCGVAFAAVFVGF